MNRLPSRQLSIEIADALTYAREASGLSLGQFASRLRATLGTRWPSSGTLRNWEQGIGNPPALVLYAAYMIAELRPPIRGGNSRSLATGGEPIPLSRIRIPRFR